MGGIAKEYGKVFGMIREAKPVQKVQIVLGTVVLTAIAVPAAFISGFIIGLIRLGNPIRFGLSAVENLLCV
jgi:hypothetical protein